MQAWERDVPGMSAAKAEQGLFRSAVSTLQAKSLAIVGASERARWPSAPSMRSGKRSTWT